VFRNGSEIACASDPQALQALTGELIDIVCHTANLLGTFSETLQTGQIIIAGSITPPLWVAPGEVIVFQFAPIDTISIRFAAHPANSV
jgi:2-keto-4-pentenoate hydratase